MSRRLHVTCLRLLRHSGAAASALIAAPLGAAALLARPSWRAGLGQRLGAAPDCAPRDIWIHAASLGEVRAAASLGRELSERGFSLFISTATVSACSLVPQLLPAARYGLMPLDHPWCVDRALHRVSPGLLCLVEAELWPTWIAAAVRGGIPVAVVSGRMSDRSFNRYARLNWLTRPTFQRLAAVGARSDLDAERFAQLGVPEERVRVTGDLKLDPRSTQVERVAPELAHALDRKIVFLAGCTQPGEEDHALAAAAYCERAGHDLLLVLAPRRIERVTEVVRAVRKAGWKPRLRSGLGADSGALEKSEVLILDTLGELPALYSLASVAFVGGTLAGFGGHNVAEPVAAGCPVIFGANTGTDSGVAEKTIALRVGTRIARAEDLAAVLVSLLLEGPEARRRVEAARDRIFAGGPGGGASSRTADLLLSLASEGSLGR